METTTHTIYAHHLEELENRINRANRRATRRGLEGYSLTVSPANPEPVYNEDEIKGWHRENGKAIYPIDAWGCKLEPEYYRERITVTIGGIVPKLPGGWRFIGIVDEDPIIGPMPKLITDDARTLNLNLDEFRDLDTWNECDHCHTNRDRRKVYLLRSEAGAIVKVGSKCISDFLGIRVDVPEDSFGKIIEGVEDLEGKDWGTSPGDRSYIIVDVLALAYAVVETYGWLNAENSRYEGKPSTGERVQYLMDARDPEVRDERNGMIDSVPADVVAEMVDYAKNLRDNDDSEYARTISAIVCGNHDDHKIVSWRNLRILASVVSGFQRMKAREAAAVSVVDSEFVGTIKKRATFPGVKVIFTRIFEGYYGDKQLVKLVDQAGNLLVWWNTGSSVPRLGETYDVTGTVREHDEYQGIKQTVLTRCKLVAC